MTRLEKIIEETGRLLPEQCAWHVERFKRFKDKGPFKLLIQIVLSHQTTIKIEDLAIEQLWSKFQTVEELARASFDEVDPLIRNVNYHQTKSRRIIEISRAILQNWQGNLDFLHHLSLKQGLEKLTNLPGVGRKTAAVVLLGIFDKPIFPVDTNVFRVAKELGLVDVKDNAETVSKRLGEMMPPDSDLFVKAHSYLLALGQATSRGRNPELIDRLRGIK